MTPEASEPRAWKSWSWRLPHSLSRPRRVRNPNVGSGSKIELHTVLKLMELAITATTASSGASSGSAISCTCRERRGSLSSEANPSNIPISSLRTTTAR